MCLLALDTPTLSSPVLLTASLAYGVVARSQPLTGKIAKGYLDAAGMLNGLGNGNPNAEFSPNLAQCVITSAGATAKVLWAFKNGAVAVTSAQRAADFGKVSHVQWSRCREQEAHVGSIEHAAWINVDGSPNRFFATAGIDGHVKLWDADKLRCLWTSPRKAQEIVRDSFVRVAVNAVHGAVAALCQSGESIVWTGLSSIFDDAQADHHKDTFYIRPVATHRGIPTMSNTESRSALSFELQLGSASMAVVLLAFKDDAFFHKTVIDLATGRTECIVFGQELLGKITAMQPVLSFGDERDFVVVGDVFGYVNVFALDGTPTPSPPSSSSSAPPMSVAPLHRFRAFDGAAVSALRWSHATLLVGSSVGTLKAFDATTFALLRDFKLSFVRTLTSRDAITHIQVVRDILVASVDDRVYAWRGEPLGNLRNVRGKRTIKMPSGIAKWHQQVEMNRDIMESRRELEHETAHIHRAFGREREQHTTLENLGLNEVEAVEYILMLSRDEEENKQTRRHIEPVGDSVFAGQFDEDMQTPIITPSAFMEGSSGVTNQPSSNVRWSTPRTPPSLVASLHASRVQVSPRFRPEPMEAGVSDGMPRSLSSSSNGDSSSSMSLKDESHFPAMATTPTRASVSGSLESVRSAWSVPLKSTRSSEGPSSPRGGGSVASSPVLRSPGPGMSLLSARFAQMNTKTEADIEEDEELRFAIELSLAEARSRGEDV
ncbi:hypothetical protein BC835DRAFT_1418819 [Cytidiella melzeri]|nr:hypothetical protein BC835DRAFT_1418819 [Cytidiella melzeri]